MSDGIGKSSCRQAGIIVVAHQEVLIAIGTVVGTLIPVFLFILKLVSRHMSSRIRVLEGEKRNLLQRILKLESGDVEKEFLEDLKRQLKEAQNEVSHLLAINAEMSDKATTLEMTIKHLQGSLGDLQEDVAGHQHELNLERRRLDRALTKDGQTWNEKVLSTAPEFKPLDPETRKTPILSVLNLKGGVGKTTVTTNLAAALDALGYRVLVIDMDLQGSLTGLFLSEERQVELSHRKCLLEDFLAASFEAEFPNLLRYTLPIMPDGKSSLMPASDYLAYAEMTLTMRWLLREGNRDVRFLLRKELHLKRVTNNFDIILLDCPPLINVCCVNALAASDYLLIPVMPSKQALARVPALLERLKAFRENVNPSLKVMGVLANRTSRSELTNDEQTKLNLLREQCRDVWGEQVPQFSTFIRQNTAVREAEDQNRPLRPDDAVYGVFMNLAREVESRLPMFCRANASKKEVVS